MATHYEVLGVPPTATLQEIRRAYYGKARRHHPDLHVSEGPAAVDQARRAMAAYNAAWSVLGDPALRREYDRALRPPHTTPAAPQPGDEPVPEEAPAWASEVDVDERALGLRSQAVVLVPMGLLATSVATFVLSTMMSAPPLMAVSIVLLPVAAVGFVAAPLLTIRRGRGRAPDPG